MNTAKNLAEKYIPLANKMAYKRSKSLPRHIDLDELRSAAYLGLVEAANRFDPSQGVSFSTFAYPRIFGAMQDYLRDQGWFKRGDFRPMLSLEAQMGDEGECFLKDTLESKVENLPDEGIELITLPLGQEAAKVFKYYFIDEYSMKEVGERFGVSESRISQMIKSYKDKIKEKWDENTLRSELAA